MRLALLAFVSVLGCSSAPSAAPPVVITIASATPDTTPAPTARASAAASASAPPRKYNCQPGDPICYDY